MKSQKTCRSRRAFLKKGAAGVALSALGTLPQAAIGKHWSPSHTMQYRLLGRRTQLKVSEIGFGGYAINDPDVIHYAADKGINYIDTAYDYRGGESEIVIGKAMRTLRHQFVLTTKWHPWSGTRKEAMLRSLETSLKRLQTDHVDCLLVHQVGKASGGESIERLQNPELYEAYEQAKQQGKVRFAGVSGHDGDLMSVMNWVVAHGYFDVLLMRYNFMRYPEQDALIQRARAKGIGVIAMKTLSGAKGEQDPRLYRQGGASYKQAALKWVLSNPHVSNLVITIANRSQVDEYAAVSGSRFTRMDQQLLDYYARTYGSQACMFCNQCESACPYGVPVADILRYYMYCADYHLPEQGRLAYLGIPEARRAHRCRNCSAECMGHCPMHIDIRQELSMAHRALGGDSGGSWG